MQMEKTVFTNLTREDFHSLIIDAVNACLKHHDKRHTATKPERASQTHAEKRPILKNQK